MANYITKSYVFSFVVIEVFALSLFYCFLLLVIFVCSYLLFLLMYDNFLQHAFRIVPDQRRSAPVPHTGAPLFLRAASG